jgi:hypothetical protein
MFKAIKTNIQEFFGTLVIIIDNLNLISNRLQVIVNYLDSVHEKLSLTNTKLDELLIVKQTIPTDEQDIIDEAFKQRNGLYSFRKKG